MESPNQQVKTFLQPINVLYITVGIKAISHHNLFTGLQQVLFIAVKSVVTIPLSILGSKHICTLDAGVHSFKCGSEKLHANKQPDVFTYHGNVTDKMLSAKTVSLFDPSTPGSLALHLSTEASTTATRKGENSVEVTSFIFVAGKSCLNIRKTK